MHRDLKPENLLVMANGRVKILDFGLAKLMDGPLGAGGAVHSETAGDATHTSITMPGMVLGTVGYMSPEQIRGLPTDHRSDIFLVRRDLCMRCFRAAARFAANTTADTMMAILKEPHTPVPADRNLPAALERIVDRCLEKAAAARFQSASDLAFALEGLSSHSDTAVMAPPAAPARAWAARLPWAVAALFALSSLVLVAAGYRRAFVLATAPTYRSSILPPEHVIYNTASPAGGLALSPDGRRLVFTAQGPDGRTMLWVRSLDGLTAQELAGTEFSYYPFWSPDSRSIGFLLRRQASKGST